MGWWKSTGDMFIMVMEYYTSARDVTGKASAAYLIAVGRILRIITEL